MHCGYAKHHVWIRGGGECSPCPFYNLETEPLGDHRDFESFFLGPEMDQLRADLAAGIKRRGCHLCWEAEKIGKSCRIEGNERHFTDPSAPVSLTALEISAGRTCTLKCRMCGSDSSTAWAAEYVQRGMRDDKPTLDWRMVPRHLLKDLRYLKVTGGEPFLSPNLATLFADLHADGISDQIEVEIFTNVEQFPDARFTDHMRDFKALDVFFSIDGVGHRNEYIRSGSSWPRSMDTMRQWGQWKARNQLTQLRFHISHTYTIFNCLYCLEMVDWIREIRAYDGLAEITLKGSHLAVDDSWHSVPRLPDSIKQEIVDEATAMLRREYGPESRWQEAIIPDHQFYATVRAALQWTVHEPPTASFDQWWNETLELDRLRGQDIRLAIPEVVDMLRRHGLISG